VNKGDLIGAEIVALISPESREKIASNTAEATRARTEVNARRMDPSNKLRRLSKIKKINSYSYLSSKKASRLAFHALAKTVAVHAF
jgi:hypothetical protein